MGEVRRVIVDEGEVGERRKSEGCKGELSAVRGKTGNNS